MGTKLWRRWLAGILGLSAMVWGCARPGEWVRNGLKVGPEYCPPPAPVASKWIDEKRVGTQAPDDSRWWVVFDDPVLASLVEGAYRQNLSLGEAAFRIAQAQAKRGIAVGGLFPQQQQAFADYSRNAVSTSVANRQLTDQRFYDLYDGGFNLTWELDLWGRLRRAVEAADAELNVSIEDYDATLVLLVANVAESYVQARTLQTQLAYARANAVLQKKTYDLVKFQFDNGKVSDLDVEQAATNLAQTEALIPPLEIALRQSCNRLCTLLGMPPEDLAEKLGSKPIPAAPATVAAGIPGDLLRRRPDVRRAERQLAAQCARIGIATAQLYPQISITGTIGLESSRLAAIGQAQSLAGDIGPSLRWDILNYGRNLNRIRLEDARFQELVLAYQNAVLTANEEVENGLVAFLQSQTQIEAQARAVKASKKSVELVLVQLDEGTADINRVYVLEKDLVQQENQLAQAQGNVALGLIQVYRALGGGWQIRLANGPDASPLVQEGGLEP
jgi:NodT family efflux transporter outer membrane factor (OMF) lipoprotein